MHGSASSENHLRVEGWGQELCVALGRMQENFREVSELGEYGSLVTGSLEKGRWCLRPVGRVGMDPWRRGLQLAAA